MILRKLFFLMAMLSLTSGVNAGSAVFLVTGTITPSGCQIALGGGGIADYGELSAATVRSYPVSRTSGSVYVFPKVTIPLSVICFNSMKFALAVEDNLAFNRMLIDADDFYRFGLIDENGVTLGAYEVDSSALTINGGQASAAVLGAPNSTNFWLSGDTLNRFSDRWQNGYSFGYVTDVNHYEPDAVSSIEGNLTFNALVDRARIDSITSRIVMKGSGTVTLVYL